MSLDTPIIDTKHCTACQDIISNVPMTQALIDKCKACGLDTSEFQQQLDQQEAMARAIVTNFFPDTSSADTA